MSDFKSERKPTKERYQFEKGLERSSYRESKNERMYERKRRHYRDEHDFKCE